MNNNNFFAWVIAQLPNSSQLFSQMKKIGPQLSRMIYEFLIQYYIVCGVLMRLIAINGAEKLKLGENEQSSIRAGSDV